MRILLVDDDELLAQKLTDSLIVQHYVVDVARDGEAGWDFAQSAAYDLIMLDVNLPKLDGIRLCQRLRQQGYAEPILLLTAKGESSDKVMGLDAGADDYVVKPCTPEELCARIRALLRRQQPSSNPILAWGELQLNPGSCEVTYARQVVPLSAKEYSLLELFLRQPQRVFSSNMILEHLWSFENAPGEETIRTHIKRLRRKLKAAGAEEMIDTVYGIGYRLKPLSPSTAIETIDASAPPVRTPPTHPPSTTTQPDAPANSQANLPTNPQPDPYQARAAAIALWDQFKATALERMTALDHAIAALQAGQFSEALRQQAEQAAHKLAGSLGMFGFPEGSRLGQEIEHQFQTGKDAVDLPYLQSLVARLHQELQQSPPSLQNPGGQADSQTAVSQTQDKAPAAPADPFPLQPFQPEITVLAVDDDPTILAALNQFLPPWGIRLTTLADPRQLLELLETTVPDLLILDIEMPQIRGIQLCQIIRCNRTWDGIPILFLSTHRDAETIHQLYRAGADDYIAKPFTQSEVITRIFNRLERNRLLRNLGPSQ